MGTEQVPVAYDVTYEFDGQQRTVRLPERPLQDRLPIVDGRVMTQVAAVEPATTSL